MSVTENKNAFVNPTGPIGLSQMFTVTGAGGNPNYLVLTVLDRNEYPIGVSGATGSLSGNGHRVNLGGLGGDGRGAGVVFAYQPLSDRYYSNTLGYFDELAYTASTSAGDVTNLSVFGTSNLTLAMADASNTYAMMRDDAGGYLGSATVVTQPYFSGMTPAQATPKSIASVAIGFVGQTWNSSGCWILTSTIAAYAGASLPVQTTAIGIRGQVNGEWIVAFNGPAGDFANWQAMVTAGEVIVIGTPGGGGHITTCVSGSGATAMLVDNATFIGSNGQVRNPANDGSPNDIIIAAPHAASQEWAGVQASSVVIYQLDTPVVTTTVASVSLGYLASKSLGSLFSATDPAGKSITQWQVYDTAAGEKLAIDGITYDCHSDTTALSTGSLNAVSLFAASLIPNDTVEVRAYNGTYWGDWQPLVVSIVPSPPTLTWPTHDQTWTTGKAVSLTLPSGTFTDPQGQGLAYTANLSSGQPLPGWLHFDPTTETFSGTAQSNPRSLSIKVTATDTSGLSASETFSAFSVIAPIRIRPDPLRKIPAYLEFLHIPVPLYPLASAPVRTHK
jgi:Putative Ig domain